MRSLIAAALLGLSGCVSAITGSTYTDGRFWFSNVKSASDIAGGPRQDIVIIVDHDGSLVGKYEAAGGGTLQAVASGLSAAIVSAGGQVAGSALVRPARNSTTVDSISTLSVSGGAGGTSASTSTGGAATAAGGTATGGAGGSSQDSFAIR